MYLGFRQITQIASYVRYSNDRFVSPMSWFENMLSQKFGHVLVILIFVTWISLICEKKSICKMPLKKQMRKKKILEMEKKHAQLHFADAVDSHTKFYVKGKNNARVQKCNLISTKKKRHISDYVKIAKFEKKLNQLKRNDFF